MGAPVQIERFLIEVIRDHQAQSMSWRVTCLRCGEIPTERRMSDLTLGRAMAAHVCDSERLRRVNHEHWREIVRDAFLAGRDAEAIEIICHELSLVSP